MYGPEIQDNRVLNSLLQAVATAGSDAVPALRDLVASVRSIVNPGELCMWPFEITLERRGGHQSVESRCQCTASPGGW